MGLQNHFFATMLFSIEDTKCFHHNVCFRYILAQALLEVHAKENVTLAPNSCTKAGTVWHTGKILFEYIRKQILVSGKLFDNNPHIK